MKLKYNYRRFVLANAQVDTYPIIYCNDGFCELVGFSRAELMRRPATAEFLHGPLTSQQAAGHIREALTARTERQIEILYYRKDGTNFLCSQVTAPIRNEEGEISMFIMNFEDITDAPFRDDVISPCTSPIMTRSKSYRFWSLLGRSSDSKDPEDVMLTPEAENVALDTFEGHFFDLRRQSAAVDKDQQGPHPLQLQKQDNAIWRTSSSFKEKGTLSAAITSNNLSKSLPNASSDSDLSRMRHQRKSPSLSNVISESHSRQQKENSSAKMLLKEMHSHKLYMGEKVAQVLFLLNRSVEEYKIEYALKM